MEERTNKLEEKAIFKILNNESLNIPIDDSLWEYYIEEFDKDFNLKERFEKTCKLFHDEFNGSYSNFIKKYYYCIDNFRKVFRKNNVYQDIANSLTNINGKVKDLIDNCENSKYTSGHIYISIDLVNSFGQILDFYHAFGLNSWSDYKKVIVPYQLLYENKNFIMDCFAGLIENSDFKEKAYILLNKVLDGEHEILKKIKETNVPFLKLLVDELIWDITGFEDEFKGFIGDCRINGINVHITMYKYEFVEYDLKEKHKKIGIKTFLDGTGRKKYQIILCDELMQVHKLYEGKEIEDRDLYYSDVEKSIKFEEPIKNFKIIKGEG